MTLLSPGEIIQQVMRAHLEVVAIGETLIQSQKCVPWLVRIAQDPNALPGESPTEGIGKSGAQDSCVANGKSFTVVDIGLLGSIARQEGGTRIANILQVASPKDEVLAVGAEAVIRTSDENIVVQAGRRAENETGVVQTVTGEKVVGNRPTRAEGSI